MDVRFLSQPLASSDSLDTFIDCLVDPAISHISIVSAWAKRSGLARVSGRLAAFRSRGGLVQMIVGVSEGGATEEGLQLAMDLSDSAFVFHHPGRTFHPKVYKASGPLHRELLVGSSNMTAGGLGWNYESSLWLSETGSVVSQPFADADQWITDLLVQPMSCKRLDPALIAQLLSSTDIRIGSEAAARRVSSGTRAPEDSDSVSNGSVSGLFSASALAMRPLPLIPGVPGSSARSRTSRVASAPGASSAATPSIVAGLTSAAPVLRRWSRDLDHTAAQQVLGANSNPTGNLRLTQAGHGIRHDTYFYKDLFGGLPWAPRASRPTEQEVLVDFDCTIDGTSLGTVAVRLSHDPSRISGQANIPTLLHWGGTLGAQLRARSFVNEFVSIERLTDGTFRLTIGSSPAGPFIA